jgi:CHAT domain-containing protein
LCGLVLARANESADGLLSAEEVTLLDLRGCELAVLSACETGLGTVAGGQGVLGLQRAFHAAEARATLTSLWSVSDAATSVLMEEFYKNCWRKKMTRLEALRQAQFTILNNPALMDDRRAFLLAEMRKRDPKRKEIVLRGPAKVARLLPGGGKAGPRDRKPRTSPTFWAAFVLSGDGGGAGDRRSGPARSCAGSPARRTGIIPGLPRTPGPPPTSRRSSALAEGPA